MKIPNADHAFVDIIKLRQYVLNSEHRVGQHKARLFAAKLGMNDSHAEELREILLKKVKTEDALVANKDKFGQRYTIDFVLKWRGQQALIRSG